MLENYLVSLKKCSVLLETFSKTYTRDCLEIALNFLMIKMLGTFFPLEFSQIKNSKWKIVLERAIKTHWFVYIFSCLFTNQLLRLTAAESYSKNSRLTDDMLNNFWSWFEKRWRHCYNYDWLRDPNLFGDYCYWLSYRIEMFIYGFRDQLSLTNKLLLSKIDSVRVILVKIKLITGKSSQF